MTLVSVKAFLLGCSQVIYSHEIKIPQHELASGGQRFLKTCIYQHNVVKRKSCWQITTDRIYWSQKKLMNHIVLRSGRGSKSWAMQTGPCAVHRGRTGSATRRRGRTLALLGHGQMRCQLVTGQDPDLHPPSTQPREVAVRNNRLPKTRARPLLISLASSTLQTFPRFPSVQTEGGSGW